MNKIHLSVGIGIALMVAVAVAFVIPSFALNAENGLSVTSVAYAAYGDGGGDGGGCCGGGDGGGGGGGGTPTPSRPSCTIYASPSTIQYGNSSTLSWSSSNASYASINRGIGSVNRNGSYSVSPNSTTTYTLTVTGSGGTANCQTTIIVRQPQTPSCAIYANPSNIQNGGSSTLTWSSNNATSASLSGIGAVGLSGSTSVSPSGTTTYTLTVTGQGGTVNCQTTITVTYPQTPACSISANPSTIQYGNSSTLSWNSSNATSASLSSVGSVGTSGSRSVSPSGTMTYTLTVSGPGGSATCETVVVVIQQQSPSCTISANPSSIQTGGSSYLTWSSQNASSASLSSVGSVGVNGNQTVYPHTTTSYVLTVYGLQGQSAQCETRVRVHSIPVDHVPPSCWITITPQYGHGNTYNQATLSWGSNYATSAFISPNVGSASTSGSRAVSISGYGTYTMTVYGQGGTATCQTQAQVIPPPPPPIYYPPQVALTQIPYTGLDLGLVGNALYWLSILSFAAAGAYLVVYYKGGAMTLATAAVGRASSRAERAVSKVAQKIDAAVLPVFASFAKTSEDNQGMNTSDAMVFQRSEEGTAPRIVIVRN